MNTSEHIVESYFRLVRRCFTITDIKIIDGINRQFDLLALDSIHDQAFHVETSVTHQKAWIPSLSKITPVIEHKFLGYPRPHENGGRKTDAARGINYFENIRRTYQSYGLNPSRVKRVICVWDLKATPEERTQYLREREKRYHFRANTLSFLLFRDEVLPQLLDTVGTSHYDDEILRSFSLLKQHARQTQNART